MLWEMWGDKYRAPYIEVQGKNFANVRSSLKGVLPEGFEIGDQERPGNVLFRHFRLPDDPIKRQRRINHIAYHGSDRTSWFRDTNFPTHKIPAIYWLWADTAKALSTLRTAHWVEMANALLVYDFETDNGLIQLDELVYTFKNRRLRNRSLLAIVGLI